jgi:microcystin degradation protein MlrC
VPIVLLCGGDKNTQTDDIKRAKSALEDIKKQNAAARKKREKTDRKVTLADLFNRLTTGGSGSRTSMVEFSSATGTSQSQLLQDVRSVDVCSGNESRGSARSSPLA